MLSTRQTDEKVLQVNREAKMTRDLRAAQDCKKNESLLQIYFLLSFKDTSRTETSLTNSFRVLLLSTMKASLSGKISVLSNKDLLLSGDEYRPVDKW